MTPGSLLHTNFAVYLRGKPGIGVADRFRREGA